VPPDIGDGRHLVKLLSFLVQLEELNNFSCNFPPFCFHTFYNANAFKYLTTILLGYFFNVLKWSSHEIFTSALFSSEDLPLGPF
jgi:hypothetical protein